MDVDGARVAVVVVPPHRLQQPLAVEHDVGTAQEGVEQLELALAQPHRLAGHAHLAARGVEHDVADGDGGLVPGFGGGAVPVAAAQRGLDARDHLARVERLRDVVVRAHLQPDDLVDVLGARGEHQHGHARLAADGGADLEPVEAGHHQVEQDEVGIDLAEAVERLAAVGCGDDLVAFVAEVEAQQAHDVGFVVGYEDAGGHRLGPCLPRAARAVGAGSGSRPGGPRTGLPPPPFATAPTTVFRGGGGRARLLRRLCCRAIVSERPTQCKQSVIPRGRAEALASRGRGASRDARRLAASRCRGGLAAPWRDGGSGG